MYRKQLSREQAVQKIKHYCAYQERCHSEVEDKLFQLGVRSRDHDAILAQLIEENYLNEERFAIAFAGGRFRLKKWGRIKIRHELKKRKVSEYCIKKALGQIDEEEYQKTLKKLAGQKKSAELLIRKGYEPELVYLLLKEQ
jgi:regulatory protein